MNFLTALGEAEEGKFIRRKEWGNKNGSLRYDKENKQLIYVVNGNDHNVYQPKLFDVKGTDWEVVISATGEEISSTELTHFLESIRATPPCLAQAILEKFFLIRRS